MTMKLYQDLHATLDVRLLAAMRKAARAHRSVRAAAAAIGMPKSTFHDVATRHRIPVGGKAAR